MSFFQLPKSEYCRIYRKHHRQIHITYYRWWRANFPDRKKLSDANYYRNNKQKYYEMVKRYRHTPEGKAMRHREAMRIKDKKSIYDRNRRLRIKIFNMFSHGNHSS